MTNKNENFMNDRPGTHAEFLNFIQSNEEMSRIWETLSPGIKSELEGYYNGTLLPRLTSDNIFKHIFSPERHPERLSQLLSLLIGEPVTVKSVLPLESIPESNFSKKIILDLLVELSDNSLANVEIQRISLDFSIKRAVVLSSNLIMRQYSILKEQTKRDIDYETIQKVYTIVFLENDHSAFADLPFNYLHKAKQTFNTGAKIDMMQEYIFVELNKFSHLVKTIDTELDAWLKFIIARTPTEIIELISKYSSFQSLYNDVTMFMKDRKEMMTVLFQTISEIDENSIKKMIAVRDARIAEGQAVIEEKDAIIAENQSAIEKKDAIIAEVQSSIEKKDAIIAEAQSSIEKKDAIIAENQSAIVEKDKEIARLKAALASMSSNS